MKNPYDPTASRLKLAAGMTRAASRQTYYTIRFLVDRPLVADAYRAYAYFRWVDDCLDVEIRSSSGRIAFLQRQQSILDRCYQGAIPENLSKEEQMLAHLVRNDREENSGLQSYLRNMMAVMVFDVNRRGRMVSQADLSYYTDTLSRSVTDALLYFIGHDCPAPISEIRYQAVKGAHIVHMLRDLLDDADVGYFNIPREVIEAGNFTFKDVDHPLYKTWVRTQVEQALALFKEGHDYIARVKNLRCRLAGFAYIGRFEWMAHAIEQDGYRLNTEYSERKSSKACLWVAGRTLSLLFGRHRHAGLHQSVWSH